MVYEGIHVHGYSLSHLRIRIIFQSKTCEKQLAGGEN